MSAACAADHFGGFLLLIRCRLFRPARIHLSLSILLRLPTGFFDVDRTHHVRISLMSAGDAFEQRLRLAFVFGNTAAYRAGATCILRRHRINVPIKSQRLPIKLGEKYPSTLIENGTVETTLLCNATAGLLNSSLRRCRHVLDLQALSENLCVVLADIQRDLFDEITTDIGDMLM